MSMFNFTYYHIKNGFLYTVRSTSFILVFSNLYVILYSYLLNGPSFDSGQGFCACRTAITN